MALGTSTMTALRKALAPAVASASVVKGSLGSGHAIIRKSNDEKQVVYGEVYAPGFPDSQGDFMTAESIQKMAWDFMRKSNTGNIDVQHNQELSGAYVVESFVAADTDSVFIPGSWVIGVKIEDPALWELVKSGELNGFSIDGIAVKTEKALTVVLPSVVKGDTTANEDHTHTFEVNFSEDGAFLGGVTGPGPDGHVHAIKSGTVTEITSGHKHRFSFVEGILNVQ